MSESNNAAPSQSQIDSLLSHYQARRYSEAETLAVSIARRFPQHQFSWKVLGAVLQETGRAPESLAPNRKSVELAPQDAEAHYNLGNTWRELGRLEEAEASHRQAIALKPGLAEAHNNLGNTLKELERLEEAEASYKKAIALKPGYAEAHFNLGLLFYSVKKYEKALEPFTSSGLAKSKYYLLRCLYEQDKQSLFFDQLDRSINQGEVHPMLGSLGCRAFLRYGVERPNLFCKEPLKYVWKTDLKKKYDFEKLFVRTIKTILNENKVPSRRQGLLTNGQQTSGNLFQLERELTADIQKIIRSEIENYRAAFKESAEGLITHWPVDYNLIGWLVSIKSGGELRPHMHEQGWISGTVYINIPPKSKADSGNLVVSLGEEKDAADSRQNTKKTVDVVTGDLVLFPASLMHYTIPFESDEERICIAFDVIRK